MIEMKIIKAMMVKRKQTGEKINQILLFGQVIC